MDEFYYNAGHRIRVLREKRGFTREQLAELSNISTKFLYEIETGQKGFSARTLSKLSESLSTHSDYIIRGEMLDGFEKVELAQLINTCDKNQVNMLHDVFSLLND